MNAREALIAAVEALEEAAVLIEDMAVKCEREAWGIEKSEAEKVTWRQIGLGLIKIATAIRELKSEASDERS